MIRHLLFFLFIISFTLEAKSQECPTIPQVLESGEIVLTSECSPFTFDKSLVISYGTKLTIGDGVTFNFTGSDKYIDVRGELVIGKGVTINMGNGTYIKTEGEGLIDVNGVESDSVTFTGSNWRGIWTNNSNGSSSIKYSRIIQEKSNGGDWNDWFLLLSRTTLENSRISQARFGVSAAASTLKNNKIHNLKRVAAEIYGNSIATGNEIYDVNLDNSNQPAIWLWNNATFKSNRLFQ